MHSTHVVKHASVPKLIVLNVLIDFGRSLIAAYLLVLNGYTNVYHLDGGLYTWFKEGLPSVGEE
jgi:3-mercaptopyruvate sulfurtransferase SseA